MLVRSGLVWQILLSISHLGVWQPASTPHVVTAAFQHSIPAPFWLGNGCGICSPSSREARRSLVPNEI